MSKFKKRSDITKHSGKQIGGGSKNDKIRFTKEGIFLAQGDEPEMRIAGECPGRC